MPAWVTHNDAAVGVLVSLAASLLACGAVEPEPASRKGPLPVRSEMPLSRLFLQLPAEPARALPDRATALALSASYTSVFTGDGSAHAFVTEDAELLAVDAAVRHGLGAGMEIGIGLPLRYTTSGFLDAFLHRYHDALGLPDGGREDEVDGQFSGQLVHDGHTAWHLSEDRIGLGDVPIWWAGTLLHECPVNPAVKAKLAIEIPTGAQDQGFGNGKPDAGAQLLLEKGFGRWVAYGSAAGLVGGRPNQFRAAGVQMNPYHALSAGGELRLSTTWSLLTQLDYLASPLHGFGASSAADDQLLLSYGTAFAAGSVLVKLFMIENLVGDTAPDFTIQGGIELRF